MPAIADLLGGLPARHDTVLPGIHLIDLPHDARIHIRVFRSRKGAGITDVDSADGGEVVKENEEKKGDSFGVGKEAERGNSIKEVNSEKSGKSQEEKEKEIQQVDTQSQSIDGDESSITATSITAGTGITTTAGNSMLKRIRECQIEEAWKTINGLSSISSTEDQHGTSPNLGMGMGIGVGTEPGILASPCAVVRYEKAKSGGGTSVEGLVPGWRELWVFAVGEWTELPALANLDEVLPSPPPILIHDLLSCPQHGHNVSCLNNATSFASSSSPTPSSCEVVFKASLEWTILEAAVAEKLAWRAGHRVALLTTFALSPPFRVTLRPVESGAILRIRPLDLPSYPTDNPLPPHLRPFSLRPFNVPALLIGPHSTSALQDAKLSAAFEKHFGPTWKVGRNESRIAAVAVPRPIGGAPIADWSVFWCPTRVEKMSTKGKSAIQVAEMWRQEQGILTVWPTHLAQELVRHRQFTIRSRSIKQSNNSSGDDMVVDLNEEAETGISCSSGWGSKGRNQDDLMSVAAGVFDFMARYVEPEPEPEVDVSDPLDEDEDMEEVGVEDMEASSKPDDGSDMDDLFSSHSSPTAGDLLALGIIRDERPEMNVPQVILPDPNDKIVDEDFAVVKSSSLETNPRPTISTGQQRQEQEQEQQSPSQPHTGELFSALNSPQARDSNNDLDLFEQQPVTRQPSPRLAPTNNREPEGYHSRPDTEADMDFAKVTEDDFAFFDSPPVGRDDGGFPDFSNLAGPTVAPHVESVTVERERGTEGVGRKDQNMPASVVSMEIKQKSASLPTVVDEAKEVIEALPPADPVPTKESIQQTAAAPPTPKGNAPIIVVVDTTDAKTEAQPPTTSTQPHKRPRTKTPKPQPISNDIIPSAFEPLVLSTTFPMSTFAYNLPSPAPTALSSSGTCSNTGFGHLRTELVSRLSQPKRKNGYDYASAWEIESDSTLPEDDEEPTDMPPTPESVELGDEEGGSNNRSTQAVPYHHNQHHNRQMAENDEVEFGGIICMGIEWCSFKDDVEVAIKSASRKWNPSWLAESNCGERPPILQSAPEIYPTPASPKTSTMDDSTTYDFNLIAKSVLENRDMRSFIKRCSSNFNPESTPSSFIIPASTMPIGGTVLGDLVRSSTSLENTASPGSTTAEFRLQLQPLKPVAVNVGYGATIMRLCIAGLAYWGELGLQPAGGPKDVVAYIVAEANERCAAAQFLRDADGIYSASRLGKHEVGNSSLAEKGVISWTSANEAIQSISKEAIQTTIFYVLAPTLTSTTFSQVHRLLSQTALSKPPFTIIHLLSSLPSPPYLHHVLMEVYTRIPRQVQRVDFRGVQLPGSPLIFQHHAFTLAPRFDEAPPRPKFSLAWSLRSYDVLNRSRSVHVAYSYIMKHGVVVVVLSDAQGEVCEVSVVKVDESGDVANGGSDKQARLAMRRATKVWAIAQAFADTASADWQMVLCSLGPISQDEIDAWRTISGARQEPFTLLMVDYGVDLNSFGFSGSGLMGDENGASGDFEPTLVRPRAAVGNVPNAALADPAAAIIDESLVATLITFVKRTPVDLPQPERQIQVQKIDGTDDKVNAKSKSTKTNIAAEKSNNKNNSDEVLVDSSTVLARVAYSDASFAITMANPTATQHTTSTFHVMSHRPPLSSSMIAPSDAIANGDGNGSGGVGVGSVSSVPNQDTIRKMGDELYALACLGRKRYGFESSLPAHVEAVREVKNALEVLRSTK